MRITLIHLAMPLHPKPVCVCVCACVCVVCAHAGRGILSTKHGRTHACPGWLVSCGHYELLKCFPGPPGGSGWDSMNVWCVWMSLCDTQGVVGTAPPRLPFPDSPHPQEPAVSLARTSPTEPCDGHGEQLAPLCFGSSVCSENVVPPATQAGRMISRLYKCYKALPDPIFNDHGVCSYSTLPSLPAPLGPCLGIKTLSSILPIGQTLCKDPLNNPEQFSPGVDFAPPTYLGHWRHLEVF